MPFQYTPYRNRYVGSITDLMGRGRDAEAQALITAANAQAQAAQISGQAWGGAVQGIGNTIAAIPGQMQAGQDRDRVMEQRERADQTRAMTAEIFNPAHTIGPVIPEGTYRGMPPTTPGAAVEGPNAMAGDFPAENIATGLELPNRYKTKNANGSSIFDRGKIIETYVAAGLDPPNLAAFDAFNESVTRNYDEYLQQSRIMATDLLKEPPETWATGARTILDVLDDNGIFPAEKTNAARRELKAAEELGGQAQIEAVGQLLYRYTGQGTPETTYIPESSIGVTPDLITGEPVYSSPRELSGRPPDLTGDEQRLEAYARRLLPDYEGQDARLQLNDEQLLAYDKRLVGLSGSFGGDVWTEFGRMRSDENGVLVPVRDRNGRWVQQRDTSDFQNIPKTPTELIVAAGTEGHPYQPMAQEILRYQSEREELAPLSLNDKLNAERAMFNDFRNVMGSHIEIERQFEIMNLALGKITPEDPWGINLSESEPEFGPDNLMTEGSYKHKGANAASQAILVTFQKILDPDSVVRESEYARSAQGLGVLARIRGAYMKMVQGGAGVPLDQLQEFVQLASEWVDTSRISAEKSMISSREHALVYGLDANYITSSFKEDWMQPVSMYGYERPEVTQGETVSRAFD